ncbi:MAG: response regulator [Oscillospiraceae bacterium]
MSDLKILIVDDENMPRNTLVRYIDWKSLGVCKVFEAEDGIQALEIALRERPELIISDIKMPKMDGLQLAEEVRRNFPECRFVFLSGYANKDNLKEAIKLKAARFVEKPIVLDEITLVLWELAEECRAQQTQSNPSVCFFTTCVGETSANTDIFTLNKSVLREMEQYLKIGNRSAAMTALHKLVREIDSCHSTDPEYIRNIFRQLIFLYVKSAEYHSFMELTGHADNLLFIVQHAQTIVIISETLRQEFELYFNCIETQETSPLAKLQTYLEEHYTNEGTTIQSIAQAMNFTPNYLCMLYKKHTGTTINQQLTNLRLAKAQQLLCKPKIKLYDIARQVGYVDGKYFTRVFTKSMGMSPRQYRERHCNEV